MSALFAFFLALAQSDGEHPVIEFRHGIWSGSCTTSGPVDCQASTAGTIKLTFVRDANDWTISSTAEGCDKSQDSEKIVASSMKSMLAIGDRAAAQVLKSMINTRLLATMMACQIKRYDNAALNERDIVSLVTSTNAAGAVE